MLTNSAGVDDAEARTRAAWRDEMRQPRGAWSVIICETDIYETYVLLRGRGIVAYASAELECAATRLASHRLSYEREASPQCVI